MIYRVSILCCTLFFISCSEGDLLELSVDFDAEVESCANENDNTFVFYKIDNQINRSLSVNFTSTTFDITPEVSNVPLTEPIEITLNTSTNQLIYREYASPIIGQDFFCSSVPPANIGVIDELISSNGVLEIRYEALSTSDTQESFNRILTLRDITLEGNGKAIRKELLELGTEIVDIDISLDFDGQLQNCSDTNEPSFVFFKLNGNGNKSFSFNFEDASFDITPEIDDISVDNPTVINLDAINNHVVYREFDMAISDTDVVAYFCNNSPPAGVMLTKELISSSGTVEVSYEESNPVENPRRFTRTLTLKENIFEAANGNPIEIDGLVIGSDEVVIN